MKKTVPSKTQQAKRTEHIMSSNIGRAFKVQIFGESHGKMIGVTIDGLPAGIEIDEEWLNAYVQRRAAKGSAIATPRRESDIPHIISGVNEILKEVDDYGANEMEKVTGGVSFPGFF